MTLFLFVRWVSEQGLTENKPTVVVLLVWYKLLERKDLDMEQTVDDDQVSKAPLSPQILS